MDTSEQYIKMCDCPEIRNEYACIHDIGDGRETWDDKDFVKWKDRHMIWLPRQDQIQKMIECFMAETKNWRGVWALQQYFHHWFLEKANIIVNASMEQLWLAFYMHEKHKKTWDGNAWVG